MLAVIRHPEHATRKNQVAAGPRPLGEAFALQASHWHWGKWVTAHLVTRRGLKQRANQERGRGGTALDKEKRQLDRGAQAAVKCAEM
jgi:hypothetical protein